MAGAACWDGGGKRQELITGGAKGRAAGVLGRWSVDRESRIFLNANERDLGKMRLEMWERDGVPYGRGPWGTQGPGERLACSVCVGGAFSSAGGTGAGEMPPARGGLVERCGVWICCFYSSGIRGKAASWQRAERAS